MSAQKPKPIVPFDYELVEPIPRKTNGSDDAPIRVVKVLRRPRLKDLKAIAGRSNLDALGITLERLTDLPKAAIDELDTEDVRGLDEALRPFFEEDDEETSPASSAGVSDTR